MTAEPVTVHPPEHPMHALTTYELSRYRRELEHARLPEGAALHKAYIRAQPPASPRPGTCWRTARSNSS
jgi:hypothetical protein